MTKDSEPTLESSNTASITKNEKILDDKLQKTIVKDIQPSIETNGESEVTKNVLETPNEELLTILSNEASKISKDVFQNKSSVIGTEDDTGNHSPAKLTSNESSEVENCQQVDSENQSSIEPSKETCNNTEALRTVDSSEEINVNKPDQIIESSKNIISSAESLQLPEISKDTILIEAMETADGAKDISEIKPNEMVEHPEDIARASNLEDKNEKNNEGATDISELVQTGETPKENDSSESSQSEPISKQTSKGSEDISETVQSAQSHLISDQIPDPSEDISEKNEKETKDITEPVDKIEIPKENDSSKSAESQSITEQIPEESKDITKNIAEEAKDIIETVQKVEIPTENDSSESTQSQPITEQILKGSKDITEKNSEEPKDISETVQKVEIPKENNTSKSSQSQAITEQIPEVSEDITKKIAEESKNISESVETPKENDSSEPNNTVDPEPAHMYLQLYDENIGEIKTGNLILEVENISKDSGPNEFIVEMGGPPDIVEPTSKHNALLIGDTDEEKSAESAPETSGKSESESFVVVRPSRRSKSTYKTVTENSVDDAQVKSQGEPETDGGDNIVSDSTDSAGTSARVIKRCSMPSLKAAIARRKMKAGGSRTKLAGASRPTPPVKRAKSLSNPSPATKKTKNPPTPKPKGFKHQPAPIDLEVLKFPLLSHGWFRELVHRKNSTPHKQEADIYYFTPEPERKKYRSRNEIERILPKDSPLKPEHFSFSRQLLGLGPEYERERDAAGHGVGSPAAPPGKIRPLKTPKTPLAKTKTPNKTTKTSPKKSPKKTPPPGSKRVPKKSAKLLAQEETDKENEALPSPTEDTSPVTNKTRMGRPPKTPTNTIPAAEKASSKKKSVGTENVPAKKTSTQKNKGKLQFEEKKETPKRRKSAKAKDANSDNETTPELLNDDLSGASEDKFPRLKLKISNGQIDRTPTSAKAGKPQKKSSIVLKEKNSSPQKSSSEKGKRKSNVPEVSEKSASAKKDAKIKSEMGPASKTNRTSLSALDSEKKKVDSEKKKNETDKKLKSVEKTKSSSKDKSSPKASSQSDDLSGRKVPPISLTITKSPQKTIVSIKKSTDGKRPEIQVEIRKPVASKSADDARSSETKKAESKKPEVGDTSDDGTVEEKGKPFVKSMKTRKRGGFTLSKEECEIISGAKRSKHSSPSTPPNISKEEVERLSSVKVMLSPTQCRNGKSKDLAVESTEPTKKRRAVKTLEDEFDRIDQELLTAPPPKRKRTEKAEANPNGKNTPEDVKVTPTAGKQGKRASVEASKRVSKDKKENVIVNGDVKETAVERRKSVPPPSAPQILPPVSETSACHVGSLFATTSTGRHNNSIYRFVVHLFSYLTVQERLRAARVNKLFHLASQHKSLWAHVRLKNSRVQDWAGLAGALSRAGTLSLDMKKMLTPGGDPPLWPSLPAHLSQIRSLRSVDLGKCSSDVFENLRGCLVQLDSLSATLHKGQSVQLAHFNSMINLTKLKLKGYEIKKGAQNIFGPHNLSHLSNLTHLALTSVGNLNQASLDSITAACPRLRALELGSCASLNAPGAASHLSRLTGLEKLRLEIVVKEATLSILELVAAMPSLSHLELVNVDVLSGFDTALARCARIRTLLIIPTYVSQSALTNYLLLSGIGRLQNSLRLVSWGLTMELLQVTNMFAAKWKGANEFKSDGTCVPVMSPIPEFYLEDKQTVQGKSPEVDLFPISKLKKLLSGHMRTSGVSIFTVSFSNTLRHSMMK